MKKCSEEMQTLLAGCSKAEPKILPRCRPLPVGAGQPKFNQLEMVLNHPMMIYAHQAWCSYSNIEAVKETYKPSLVRIDAHNFELLW